MNRNKVLEWLSRCEPWVRYRTKIDLLEKHPDDPGVLSDFEELINHPNIIQILTELKKWPGPTVKRHNDAKLLYHKLVFLAELDFTTQNPNILPLLESIVNDPSPDGPFRVIGNIPTVFGGSGKDEPLWMLCDAPLVSYALVKMGMEDDPRVERSVQYLVSLAREFGWPCCAASELGPKFKGPGKRSDPCPYANLLMLKLISALPHLRSGEEAKTGAGVLLDLWERRKEVKYFLFGMGTDFKKLKAPFIWYDILHVTDVLTRFDFLRGDSRLLEMIQVIREKADDTGRYKPESVYRVWKDWDFGQKKDYSGWITLLVCRILNRMGIFAAAE